MKERDEVMIFLSAYDPGIQRHALMLRKILFSHLPDIEERLDAPARLIGYCYGNRYTDMICTLIPSKKELKLGFFNGVSLPDPYHLLKGEGKKSRYVKIIKEEDAQHPGVLQLLDEALKAYYNRLK
ncbi:MAG: DUF1801 domain-containing protein [Bacteroidetes bacterium]|nr:DUF1801 domain-containing protein [Bacteroidota bacterium]